MGNSSNRMRHRHDDVDRSERHRQMAASARSGPQIKPGPPNRPQFDRPQFDLTEWEHQHVEAEFQTLRYGPDMRSKRLAEKHDLKQHVADQIRRDSLRLY